MVGLQTLDLAIGVRVPASQPKHSAPNVGAAVVVVAAFYCHDHELTTRTAQGDRSRITLTL